MKKLFIIFSVFMTVFISSVSAQKTGDRDPSAMMERMKERIKPALVQKTQITDAQADKVIEISFGAQRKKREVRMDQSLSEEEKGRKYTELDEERNKNLKSIPLSEEQVKGINTFFEEFRKEQKEQRKSAGN